MTYLEHRLNHLRRSFDEQAKFFLYMMEIGDGVENIHMAETLRSLLMLYLRISAHTEAKRELELPGAK